METAFPGFVAFVPTVSTAFDGGTAVDLGHLIAAVRGVPDPGPGPDLANLMPRQLPPEPSAAATDAGRTRRGHRFGGLGCVAAGLALFGVGGPGILFGLILFALAFKLLFGTPEAFDAVGTKANAAKAKWETARKAFEQVAGNGTFLRTRQDAEALIQQAQNLPGEEARKIAALEARRRELQLRRHLERFEVDQAKVSGVDEARKLTLRSFGIETAAEVDYNRVVAIKGFGPSTANNLVKWRRSAEAKFAFDPGKAVDPQDIAAVSSEIAKSRSDLATRLNQTAGMLQKAERDARTFRTTIDPRYAAAWSAFRQAEVDLRALGLS